MESACLRVYGSGALCEYAETKRPSRVSHSLTLGRLKRLRFPVRGLAAAFMFVVLAALVARGDWRCGIARMIHIPCASCGTTRTVAALLRGEFASALRLNPIGALTAPLFVALAVCGTLRMATQGNLRDLGRHRLEKVLAYILTALIALQWLMWILRFAGWFGGPVSISVG
jgi:Protein of unknown function (DUF2752)